MRMPFKDPEKRKAKQREYVKKYLRTRVMNTATFTFVPRFPRKGTTLSLRPAKAHTTAHRYW